MSGIHDVILGAIAAVTLLGLAGLVFADRWDRRRELESLPPEVLELRISGLRVQRMTSKE